MLSLLLLGTFSPPIAQADPGMILAATALVESLSEAQAQALRLPWDSPARFDWAYTPRQRAGVALKEMSSGQRERAFALLRSALSSLGFEKVEAIRRLDAVLREIEGSSARDPELYVFTFFGRPGASASWGWRFEGHHLSLNYTFRDGRLASSTPQFLGANPAEVAEGSLKGQRALAKEEDMARELVKSLSEDQRKSAIAGTTAPRDILTANRPRVTGLDAEGIAYDELTSDQRRLLWGLVELYASVQSEGIAKERLDAVRGAGTSQIRFVWMGGLERGQGHYYRIQGPSFLIEYDNTQNRANHIHTVWRDLKRDFGGDPLDEHYRTAPHHRRRVSAEPANEDRSVAAGRRRHSSAVVGSITR